MAFRLARTIIRGKLDGDAYYRLVDYNYLESVAVSKQHYLGLGLTWRMQRQLSLSLLAEQSYRSTGQQTLRFNTRLIHRFNKRTRS